MRQAISNETKNIDDDVVQQRDTKHNLKRTLNND